MRRGIELRTAPLVISDVEALREQWPVTARTAPQSDAAQRRAKTEHPAQSPKMAATVAPAGHICVLRSNGDDGNRIPLDASAAATVTFGRALTSDVRIALAHCSRLHAELRVDQNARVSLVNHAKAANATLLNAQPLAPKAARDVRDGDVFEICGKRFRFEASVLAATTTGTR